MKSGKYKRTKKQIVVPVWLWSEAKKMEKQILKTVEPAKKEALVKEGKETKFKLSDDCNKKNISNITYETNNKNVKVDKNGNIKANQSGEATVTAIITLQNGKKKKVKMKITVK